MIGSASRTAFCVFVSGQRGTGCATLRDNGYLDVGGGLFGRQGNWACDGDGCEQHCGESGELHGGDGLFVVGLGMEGLLNQFFEGCTELRVEIDRRDSETV